MKVPSFQEYAKSTWDQIEPLYLSLLEKELDDISISSWMSDWSELRKLLDEQNARLSLATDLDTTDEEAVTSYHEFLEIVLFSCSVSRSKTQGETPGKRIGTPRDGAGAEKDEDRSGSLQGREPALGYG